MSETNMSKAEVFMTDEQKEQSEKRAFLFESKPTSGYTPIDPETVAKDDTLRKLLDGSRPQKSRRGDGVFIPRYHEEKGIDKLRKYGIPVKGALIVPVRKIEDVDHEVERLNALVTGLRNEKQEIWERNKRKVKEEQKQEREQVAERLAKKYQEVCSEFPDLQLSVTRDGKHSTVLNAESVPVWGIGTPMAERRSWSPNHSRDETCSGEPRISKFRDAAIMELEIRETRENNTQRVIDLNKALADVHATRIKPSSWEGSEIGQFARELSEEDYLLSQSISTESQQNKWVRYKWTENDLDDLEDLVSARIAAIKEANSTALEKLKNADLEGASANAIGWASHEENYGYVLSIDDEKIVFPTEIHLNEALSAALERGAYLPHHKATGERFRDMAKEEGWDEYRSSIARQISEGVLPEKGRVSVQTQSTLFGKGTGRYSTGTAQIWCIGSTRLDSRGSEYSDLRFALKRALQLENTPENEDMLTNIDNATHHELENIAKQLSSKQAQ